LKLDGVGFGEQLPRRFRSGNAAASLKQFARGLGEGFRELVSAAATLRPH